MPNLSTIEILAILFVVVLLFGARRLPELGRSLGAGIRNFKNSVRSGEAQDEIEEGRQPALREGSDQAANRS
jgi:sec-independent protein translocase protein TatA